MRTLLIAFAALLAAAALVVPDADAARLGGGRSLGAQRSIPRSAPSTTPAKPQAPQAEPTKPGAQPVPPAQPQPSFLQKWGPLLGGLAIGGLLGSLFGGGAFGGIMLAVVLALVALAVVSLIARRRSAAQAPVQYAGFQERSVLPAAESPVASSGAQVPASFDTATFLRGAKMNFVKLQVANDTGDLDVLRELTTSEMFDTLAKDVGERQGAQQTDVQGLDAELLELATEGGQHWASVRFSGTVREAAGTAPQPFTEVWNLVKPTDGSAGWLLAGIQQVN